MVKCEEKKLHCEEVERARKAMPEKEVIETMSDIFKALSDPGRLRIVLALCTEELCVCDIAEVCGLTDSAASHQLRILRNMKIVRNRREGKTIFYRIDDDHVEQLIRQSLQHAAC